MTYRDVLKEVEEECENVCIDKECSDCEAYFIKTALTEVDKYRWHDLRKNPNDLPEVHLIYDNMFSDNVLVVADKWHCPIVAYLNSTVMLWHNPLEEQVLEDVGEIIAWKYIEPFEVI